MRHGQGMGPFFFFLLLVEYPELRAVLISSNWAWRVSRRLSPSFPVGILVDEDGVDRPGSLLSRDRISDVIHPAAHRLARSPSGQRRRIFDDLDVIRVIHPRSQGRDERPDRLRVITTPTRLSLSAFTEDKNDRAPPSQRSALRRGLRSTRAPPDLDRSFPGWPRAGQP